MSVPHVDVENVLEKSWLMGSPLFIADKFPRTSVVHRVSWLPRPFENEHVSTCNTVATQDFSRPDAKRLFLTLACFACVGACNWLLLQVIRPQIIPKGVGGDNGPWVIRPILAFHYAAMAVMTAVSLPIFLAPLQRRWKREDTAAGTRYDLFTDQPLKQIRFIVASLLIRLTT